MGKKLTPKQERFCVEYAACGNAYQAAVAAGYPERSARSIGSENLTKPDIMNRIFEIGRRETKARIMSVDRRQERLTELAENSIDGNVVVRAIETLNKMDGLYIQKQEISGKDGGAITFRWDDG